jgi:hypothetical protein
MSAYSDAYRAYITAAQEATTFTHADYSNSGITRERARRLATAREKLQQALPSETATDPARVQDARAKALGVFAVTTADQATMADRQWAAVQRMLAAGRHIDQIVAGADKTRLTAILDHLETDLALSSADPEGVTAEVQSLALARAAALGVTEAQQYVEAQRAVSYSTSWRDVIASTVAAESVPVSAFTGLYHSAPDEFAEIEPLLTSGTIGSVQSAAQRLASIDVSGSDGQAA